MLFMCGGLIILNHVLY